jgi:hypothetical protein
MAANPKNQRIRDFEVASSRYQITRADERRMAEAAPTLEILSPGVHALLEELDRIGYVRKVRTIRRLLTWALVTARRHGVVT